MGAGLMGHNLVPDPQNVQGTVTANKGTGWADPQTDALTDAQLRAAAVAVQDQHSSTGPLATEAKQLPDNHNVTVSTQINQPLANGGSVPANKGTGLV